MGDIEKRQGSRRSIEHTVHVATGLGPPLKCQMLDVSETGARLRFGDPRVAPQEFLIILGEGLSRWCRVMWRSDTDIGIMFIEAPPSVNPKAQVVLI